MSLYDEIARDIQNFAGVKCALKALCERVEALEEIISQLDVAAQGVMEHMGGPLVVDVKRGPGRPRKIVPPVA